LLQAESLAGTLSPDNQKLIDKLQPFIVNAALFKAIDFLGVSFDPRGLIVFQNERNPTDEAYQAAELKRIELMKNRFTVALNRSKLQIEEFLNENASGTKYTPYFNGDLYMDPSIDINDFGNDPDDDERNGYYTG